MTDLHEILNWFTEPGTGEKHLSDLEAKIREWAVSQAPNKIATPPTAVKWVEDFDKGWNAATSQYQQRLKG